MSNKMHWNAVKRAATPAIATAVEADVVVEEEKKKLLSFAVDKELMELGTYVAFGIVFVLLLDKAYRTGLRRGSSV